MKVGYIGLGALGSELVRCFQNSYELQVWDIDSAACARFHASGIRVAPTASDLGRACDVVLLCLPRSANVREVLFGPQGLAEGLSPGKLVVDQTSGVPEETRELAQRLARLGVGMMDAAVSASPHVVAHGGATLMAGGPDEVFEAVRPLLEAITKAIIRCGSRVGDGQAMKMVNNAMNAGCRLGTLELAAFGRKLGLPLMAVADVLNRGAGRNQTSERMLPAIARGEASTNFALALMLKDVNQAVQLGAATGVPMPLTRTVRGLLQIGLNTRGSEARLEDMVGVIEAMAAVRLAGDGSTAPQPDQELLGLVDQAAWAMCRAISCECMAVGLRYGLALPIMAQVLARTSGWSAALHELSSAIREPGAQSPVALATVRSTMRRFAELSIQAGAPALIVNMAGSVFDDAAQHFGGDASVDALARSSGLLPS